MAEMVNGTTLTVDAGVVHNWDLKSMLAYWKPLMTPGQIADIEAAFLRHHQKGTDAREEAKTLNARWAAEAQKEQPMGTPRVKPPLDPRVAKALERIKKAESSFERNYKRMTRAVSALEKARKTILAAKRLVARINAELE